MLDDPRTNEQLAVDTLVEIVQLATRTAGSGRVFGQKSPAVRVHVQAEALQTGVGVAHFEGQSAAVSISTAQRHMCLSGILPILFEGNTPIDVGRTQRLHSPRQRAAITALWNGCAWGGCDKPPQFTEVHHLEAFNGSNTTLANGISLCRFHHMQLHANQWSIRARADGTYWLTPPPRARARRTSTISSNTRSSCTRKAHSATPDNPARWGRGVRREGVAARGGVRREGLAARGGARREGLAPERVCAGGTSRARGEAVRKCQREPAKTTYLQLRRDPVTGSQVLHLLGDRDRVVRETLVVTRSEGRIDGVDGSTLPRLTEHLVEDTQVQRVDLVVVVADLLGEMNITGGEQVDELAGDRDIQSPELSERGTQRLGNDLVREAVTSQLGDVLGHVTHALERSTDAKGTDDDTKVPSDGLLPSEDVDGQLVELQRGLIDPVVCGDHGLSQ